MIGRLLGGIATSILYSAFESWLVCEHNKVNILSHQNLVFTSIAHIQIKVTIYTYSTEVVKLQFKLLGLDCICNLCIQVSHIYYC